ncbi:MAG: hypothetical protein R2867_43300 [Caldilineaceae bacterium]
MTKPYILAHDLGTTGNKATLFDSNGRVVASTFPRLCNRLSSRQLGRTKFGGLVAGGLHNNKVITGAKRHCCQ